MFIIQYAKTQIACFIVLIFITINYLMQCHKYGRKMKDSFYDELLELSILEVLFDGITAVTVNFPDTFPHALNLIFHAVFLLSLDTYIFFLFRYLKSSIYDKTETKLAKVLYYLPWIVNFIIVLVFIRSLDFKNGELTNYSMGISAYTCFITAFLYIAAAIVIFIRSWKFIDSGKRISIVTYLSVLILVCVIQAIFPQTLLTSVGVTLIELGIYFNLENPAFDELRRNHDAMIMGFADLVENRDENTGGHIKRTSEYVKLIVSKLQEKSSYKDILTEDYVENIIKAAPLHDIGKISTPDAVLTKPGKLDDTEYSVMKNHVLKGDSILTELLKEMDDEEYIKIAHEVAKYHHEKWNGKGYPEGLKGQQIPLSARIMSVADVFDAVSQNRCYRPAMALENCFAIIKDGRGTDFDPEVVDAFLSAKDEAGRICIQFRTLEASETN